MSISPFLLLSFLIHSFPCAFSQDNLEVSTADGPVRGGYRWSESGLRFRSFQGIPFATPPLGSLRFAPPQPAEPWEEVLDVSKDSEVKCTQYGFMSDGGQPDVSGSEDCLYLSVFTPENAKPGMLDYHRWKLITISQVINFRS